MMEYVTQIQDKTLQFIGGVFWISKMWQWLAMSSCLTVTKVSLSAGGGAVWEVVIKNIFLSSLTIH